MNGLMPEPVSGTVFGRIAGKMRGPTPQTNSGPVRDLVRYPLTDPLWGLVRYPVQYPGRNTVRATMRGTVKVLSQNLSAASQPCCSSSPVSLLVHDGPKPQLVRAPVFRSRPPPAAHPTPSSIRSFLAVTRLLESSTPRLLLHPLDTGRVRSYLRCRWMSDSTRP
jgi:hypothetical protein